MAEEILNGMMVIVWWLMGLALRFVAFTLFCCGLMWVYKLLYL